MISTMEQEMTIIEWVNKQIEAICPDCEGLPNIEEFEY